MKKTKLIVMLILVCILLSGCWNYNELNDYKIVSGFALDYDDINQQFILNIEIVNSDWEEQEMASEIFKTTGKTVFQAVRDMIKKVGRKLYWSHAQALIVSKKIAERDIISVLDMIYRDVEMRTNMWILISEEETAAKIYDSDVCGTNKITSYHIDNILKNESSVGEYHGVEVWRFIKALYTKGVSPTAPLIKITNQYNKRVPMVSGTAVFKDKKLVGTLDKEETKYFSLIVDKLKGGIINVQPDYKNEDTLVSLEVIDSKTKLGAKYVNEKIIITIKSEINVGIGETGYRADLIGKPGRTYLKKFSEVEIEKRITQVITKVQKKYRSDIFGFAPVIERDIPGVWNVIKEDWDNVFKKLDLEIDVDVNIKGSALINSTLKVKE